MSLTDLAALAGIGFVLLAITINVVYVRGGLPLPGAGHGIESTADSFAAIAGALKKPSVLAPASWMLTTVFAAGLLSAFMRRGDEAGAWALVGFAGVLMQNATFACVEALRFGLAAAATHDRRTVAGLWGFSNVLFGFNQVFLVVALVGFTVAGAGAGVIPDWHASLGYASAAMLFVSSSASPYGAEGTNRIALVGLIGWLGWAAWIVLYCIALLRI